MPNLERLAHTLQTLEKMKYEQFYLGVWSSPRGCGTVCCAVGAEASTQYANDNGLKLEASEFSMYPIFTNKYEFKSKSFHAAAHYYDISVHDAVYLFSPEQYDARSYTPIETVKARIQQYICTNLPK